MQERAEMTVISRSSVGSRVSGSIAPGFSVAPNLQISTLFPKTATAFSERGSTRLPRIHYVRLPISTISSPVRKTL